ncbi:MAG: VWA domain-containing protein [Myxococcota bacterium]
MSAADFVHPEWLVWGAIGVALAWGAVGWAALVGRRRLVRLLGTSVARHPRGPVLEAGLCLALAAIAFALAGPLWSRREVRVTSSGTDVVLLFDVSRSMDAGDNPPSRLERARRTALEVLDRVSPGDRVALAAFADRGVLLTPLTPDTRALSALVAAIDSDLIRPAGSDLADGLRAALTAYEQGSDRPRVLLVFSDGEVRPALEARDVGPLELAGVRALAVGLGSPHGTTVPDGGVPLRDSRGEIVVSRRIVGSLDSLAAGSGGRLWLTDAWGELDLDALLAEVGRDRGRVTDAADLPVVRSVRAPAVLPLAALAFALLVLELALPAAGLVDTGERRARARPGAPAGSRWARPAVASALVAGAALLGLGAGERMDPVARIDALEAAALRRPLGAAELIQLGVARYEAGRSREARHALRAAALTALDEGRADRAAIAYHDLGVLALDGDDLETARDHFLEAVALAPGLTRARFNLEWTLRAMDDEDEPPPSAPASPDDTPASKREDRTDDPDDPRADEPSEGVASRRPPPPAASDLSDPRREPSPASAGAAAGRGDGRADSPPLDAEGAERWLSRVGDDTARALRSAAELPPGERRGRGGGPAW